MSNHKWVCFSCRVAVRRSGISTDVRCSICGEQCENLGTRIPIPAKAKVKQWEALRESYYVQKRMYLLRQLQKNVREIHKLEQEIIRFEAMPENADRSQWVKKLKEQLTRKMGNYG